VCVTSKHTLQVNKNSDHRHQRYFSHLKE